MYTQLYQLLRFVKPSEFRTRRYIREFEHNQWLDPEALQQISWQKLKRLLEHAYVNVPFYRQRFQEIGLMPQDIQTEEDFRRIPLLSKNDIRQNTDLLLATNYDKDKMIRDVTSGSTGVPLVLYRGQDYSSADIAAFNRSYSWFGCELGDKIAWVWGRRTDNPKLTLRQRLRRERWLDGYRMTPESMQQFAETLRSWKPSIITGYGNVISIFAQYLIDQKITDIRPKVIQTTGMAVWPHERKRMEQAFQCPVSDRYSSHEAGAIISVECPMGNKHIFNDFCYVEILKDGQPVAPGEMGEIIITPLYNFGMPLIRYSMADVATFSETPCPCGRGLPVLRELAGRVTSIFTLPSGKLLYGGIFRHLVLQDSLAINRFQVHQYTKEKLEVCLERGAGFDESVVDLIRERCLKLLEGEPVELTIKVMNEMPTTPAGKFLVTSSEVPVVFN